MAGVAAESYEERIAAQMLLADVPLKTFLNEVIVSYEKDEITRLIIDTHDTLNFTSISHFTVGQLRDWLLSEVADTIQLQKLAKAFTPEMIAAVSKLMRNQDLILVAQKYEVITKFRNTLGLKARLQPNHPTDDPKGIAASLIDSLLYGSGDDGLSATGINQHTIPVLDLLLHILQEQGFNNVGFALVEQGRVAIGDEVGELLGAKLSVVMIGERPGLSSFDSLGVYISFNPKVGLTDESRNCISNIRTEGLHYNFAAEKMAYLITQAIHLQLSGVDLKDETNLL